MAEWLIEEGIGEERAVRLDRDRVIEARLDWPGSLAAGLVEDAKLVSRQSGSKRGTATFSTGEQALVDQLPREASEGAPLRLQVTRAAISERGRHKLALARPCDLPICSAPSLAGILRSEGHDVQEVRHFPECDWEDLWSEAWQGEVSFAGGSLSLFDTPAMTLIDIDGPDSPSRLANTAVAAIAGTLRRLDIGGMIGIDFPTVHSRKDRKFVDALMTTALDEWPHERTAMNGFGFVQLVARLERVSILKRLTRSKVGAAARMVLRRGELLDGPGRIHLTVHPAVKAKLKPEWLAELARRTGRQVEVESDPGIALAAGQAQMVAR